MKKFLSEFKNPNEERINMKLINREDDDDIIDSILQVFKSFETIPAVKFLSYTVEDDESKINFNKYITSRKNTKKREKNIKYMYTHADRVFELTMKFRISGHDRVKVIKRSLLVPFINDDGYITLKGNNFFLLYQMVDSSTYVSKMGLTMKSLMPVIVRFRDKPTILTDANGGEHVTQPYYMKVFKREISLLLFFFCRMGVSTTIRYFMMDLIIAVVPYEDEDPSDKENYYFALNKYLSLRVSKNFFDKYVHVRAVTAMIKECFNSKTTMECINSSDYWLEQLGSLYTNTKHKKSESGASTMLFFERLLDVTTKHTLKVSEVNKTSIYSVNINAA
jgi:hypothetical protein